MNRTTTVDGKTVTLPRGIVRLKNNGLDYFFVRLQRGGELVVNKYFRAHEGKEAQALEKAKALLAEKRKKHPVQKKRSIRSGYETELAGVSLYWSNTVSATGYLDRALYVSASYKPRYATKYKLRRIRVGNGNTATQERLDRALRLGYAYRLYSNLVQAGEALPDAWPTENELLTLVRNKQFKRISLRTVKAGE